MESSWTTAAWELLVTAARSPRRARGRMLEDALRQAVRSGHIAAGTRLPSSRELAADLGVSRGVVTEVYGRLVAEGHLVGRQGAGTWVVDLPRQAPPPAPIAAAPLVDFKPGSPDLSLFPRAAWANLCRKVLTEMPHAVLDYGDSRGFLPLRTELAALLSRRRGVVVDPERIIICGGFAQALSLVARFLRTQGKTLIGEELPGDSKGCSIFGPAGVSSVSIAVDENGMDVDALAASGCHAALVTPTHQFPTGIVYQPPRRKQLLEWARDTGGLIIEDDYDGEFRYDRAPLAALQSTAPDLVAYAGSVSKSLAPGMRLGWLLPPARLLEPLAALKHGDDRGRPVLDQAVLAAFLRSGRYDRQLRLCQRTYRERRDTLVRALADQLPEARVTGVAAGLHAVVTLPASFGAEDELVRAAADVGVNVVPFGRYGGTGPGFVLGFSHLSATTIDKGISLVAAAWLT
ncbi:PLP-dependent aminotransferase family protein [Fodinicola acaciae]|uniref:MocR-like pyridoxine biosynthesis transcription factor PdxR n=1 Tax=Fodinicola acaciae TaxID=2681555 RepID=UPI001C9E75A9|nr:PLP-dependent aminotransferase family protein [Fodinicola acaciae]